MLSLVCCPSWTCCSCYCFLLSQKNKQNLFWGLNIINFICILQEKRKIISNLLRKLSRVPRCVTLGEKMIGNGGGTKKLIFELIYTPVSWWCCCCCWTCCCCCLSWSWCCCSTRFRTHWTGTRPSSSSTRRTTPATCFRQILIDGGHL